MNGKIAIALALLAVVSVGPKVRADVPETQSTMTPELTDTAPAGEDPKYTAAIDKRADDIIDMLTLKDPNQVSEFPGLAAMKDPAEIAAVHEIIMQFYRNINAWHTTNDKALAALKKQAGSADAADQPALKAKVVDLQHSLKAIHYAFLDQLSSHLNTQQIDVVKEKMVYGKVKVTYNAYVSMIPNMSDEDKLKVAQLLVEAREEAIDAGSNEEKSQIFKVYKGKINIFLDHEGHNTKKEIQQWGAKQPWSSHHAATEPATEPAK